MRGFFDALRIEGRQALRGLRRSSGFTAAVALTLGLGVGANTAMFELVDRLLLRPPPGLRDAGSVHRLYYSRMAGDGRIEQTAFSYPALRDLEAESEAPEAIAAHALSRQIAVFGDRPTPVWAMGLTGNYWSFFDVAPWEGRFFGPESDRLPAGEDVAVLSWGFWQSDLGADPDVIGRTFRLGERSYTVIGVAPRGFRAMELWNASVYLPLTSLGSFHIGPDFAERAGTTWLSLVTRIPEEAVARAEDELTRGLEAHYTASAGSDFVTERQPRVAVGPVLTTQRNGPGTEGQLSLWLLGMSAIVLLVACANAATLLLGRALRRQRETAVRASLGIPAGRMLALPALESLFLALLAALVAVPLGSWIVGMASMMLLPELIQNGERLAGRSYLFGFAITLATGLAVGILPAVRTRKSELGTTLRSGGAGAGQSRSRAQLLLPMAQAALSTVLLVGAGLFVRSLSEAAALDLGYDADRVVVVRLQGGGAFSDLATAEDRTPITRMQMLRTRARGLPGVTAAEVTTVVPFWNSSNGTVFLGGESEAALGGATVTSSTVGPEYFKVFGTRVVRGRGFEGGGGGAQVAVVGENLAARLWPGADPIGQCFRPNSVEAPCMRVVGVAEDIRSGDIREASSLHYYAPYDPGRQRWAGVLALRVEGPPEESLGLIRRELQSALPSTVYPQVEPLSWIVEEQLRSWRVGAALFSAFGMLALLVAAVGIFSVIAYEVSQRKREFGVRIALGARAGTLVLLVMRRSVGGTAVGVLVGLVAAWWLAGLVESLLFGVRARDPLTYAIVLALLLVSAALATLAPALRAATVEPREVLQAE